MSSAMSMLTRPQQGTAMAMMMAVVAAFLLPSASAISPLGPWQNGIATNYGGPADGVSPSSPSFGTLNGACGYGQMNQSTYPYWSVGALATSSSFYSAGPMNGCGQCFEIECLSTVDESKGTCSSDPALRSVTVMISDECPQCASNQIDLQALTFDKMAPMTVGRINMQYRRVECTPPADMKLSILDNRGGGGWVRLSVQETGGRGAVKGVQIKGGGPSDNFEAMNNVWGAEWESPSQPNYPVSFRIVPDQGGEVTAFNVLSGSEIGMVPTHVQFIMHDQPSTGPQEEAANQGQVQAFEGPPDYAATNGSGSSNSSGTSGGGSGGGGSPPSYGTTGNADGGGSGGGNAGGASSSPSSTYSSDSTASSSSGSPSSSGEGSTSDSSATDAPVGGRRLLRQI